MMSRRPSARPSGRTCPRGSSARSCRRAQGPLRRFGLKKDRELDAMRRALELAWRGWGRVSPNPIVGAVVLRGNDVVAEGWHAEFGGPHAELNVLHAAGDKARGGTLVVTLEPCAHHGKTPPCTDAIRAAGVRRVVAAVRDPDPEARGGAEGLKRAGIDVQIGLLAEEAAAQNAPFLLTRQPTDPPLVGPKLATACASFVPRPCIKRLRSCDWRVSSPCCVKGAERWGPSCWRRGSWTACTGCRPPCGLAMARCPLFQAFRRFRWPKRRGGFPWSGACWALIHYWSWIGGYVYRDRSGGGAPYRPAAARQRT